MVQVPPASACSVCRGGVLTFEECLQPERETAKIEKERLQFELQHERLKLDVTLERERVKVEQMKFELIKDRKGNETVLAVGSVAPSAGFHGFVTEI